MGCRGSAAPTWSHHGLQVNLCFSCSSVGSHPREIVLLELVQHVSFSWAAVLHKPLQCGSSVRSQVLPESLLCHRNLRGSHRPAGTHLLWHGILSYMTVSSTPVLHFQLIQYSSTETAVPWPPASPGTSPRAAVKTFSGTNQ